ncbi:MAG: hypothetical protein HRU26_02960 [Psychroserpens sp.]|nr:hypothetical protein [Psychroserpens sp.]
MKSYIPPLVFGVIGGILILIGALFKIQHWHYGNELLIFGMVDLVFAPMYAIFLARSKNEN